jgi:LPS sulfotransferase NodH
VPLPRFSRNTRQLLTTPATQVFDDPTAQSAPLDESWAAVRERLVTSGKRFYCICFSIRSGSSLLCEDMTQWGFGAPQELFQFPEYPILGEPLSDHLCRLAEQWAGDFLGLKISWYQAAEVTTRLHREGFDSVGSDLRQVFPGLRYIHIVRRDKIAQAVSAWRAQTSGTWHWPIGEQLDPGHPPYDFDAIKLQLQRVLLEDWLWQFHFERFRIPALTVYYEDYVKDRPEHLQRIAGHLGVQVSRRPLEERLHVMRDEWTDQIVAGFTADLHCPFDLGGG